MSIHIRWADPLPIPERPVKRRKNWLRETQLSHTMKRLLNAIGRRRDDEYEGGRYGRTRVKCAHVDETDESAFSKRDGEVEKDESGYEQQKHQQQEQKQHQEQEQEEEQEQREDQLDTWKMDVYGSIPPTPELGPKRIPDSGPGIESVESFSLGGVDTDVHTDVDEGVGEGVEEDTEEEEEEEKELVEPGYSYSSSSSTLDDAGDSWTGRELETGKASVYARAPPPCELGKVACGGGDGENTKEDGNMDGEQLVVEDYGYLVGFIG